MYIPRFNAITESPSPKTSDSESAFCMIVKLDSIGVSPSLTASLNIGFLFPCLQCMVRMSSMLH